MRELVQWYDRQGRPISMEEVEPLLADIDYKRVASDVVGIYWVSTVWLGLDHNYWPGGPPLIFETMVFIDPDQQGEDYTLIEFDCLRYATEAEAIAGHEAMVLLVRATTQEEFSDGADAALPGLPADGQLDEEGGPEDQGGHREDDGRPARRSGPALPQRGEGDEHRDPG